MDNPADADPFRRVGISDMQDRSPYSHAISADADPSD